MWHALSAQLREYHAGRRVMNIPIARGVNLVEVLTALLAKIFFGGTLRTKYTHTGTMLPNFANVALNEEAGNIFSELNGGKEIGVWAVDRWATRVFFCAANAPDGLVFLLEVVACVSHIVDVYFRGPVNFIVLATLSTSAKEGVVKVVERFQRGGAGGGLG